MSKKNEQNSTWIANFGESKKLKEQWLESSKTKLPLVIIGDSGVGKSFWIERSIAQRVGDQKFQVIKVDYSVKAELFETAKQKLATNKLSILCWENISLASESEIRNWMQWWKEKKYHLDESLYIYWEIQSSELKKIESVPYLSDLFDQMKSFVFHLIPLHKRRSDISFFVMNFLENANRDLKKNVSSMDEHFHHYFTKRNFKHNLHELRDFIYSLVAFSSKKQIKLKQVPVHLFENEESDIPVRTGIALSEYEKAIINENLKLVNGNRTKAAKLLGISERNLYRKIKEFQLDDET